MTRNILKPVFFLLVIIMGGCASNHIDEGTAKQFVSTEGQRFVDPHGRHIILHGINLVNKNKDVNYLGNETPETFSQMKSWGFNCIRLGIIWDGLEPEPGIYDEEYLKGIDQRITWAGENDMYVFLDMHQDLFSVKFSDGAPEWATLDEGKPHETGDVWSASYLISPAVQTAFDNFWKNTAVEGGIGVQDHYSNAWKHLAERYADNPTVIGYDLMNEPFPGSSANMVMPAILQQYGMIVAEETGKIPTEEELMMSWGSVDKRVKLLEELTDIEKYSRIISGIGPISHEFEKNDLSKMYNKVTNAIREVDENHIIFLNHSYFSNMGIESGIEIPTRADGTKDPLVAYGAHGYDLVVDTKGNDNSSFERVGFIFDQIGKTSKKLGVPLLVGEWGAYGRNPNTLDDGKFVISKYEELLASDTYWAYEPGIENFGYLDILKRHYPVAVSGKLDSYSYSFKDRKFSCVWDEEASVTANTEIYIPNIETLTHDQITLAPTAGNIIINRIPDSQAGFLIITPTGENVKRTLEFHLKNGKNWSYNGS